MGWFIWSLCYNHSYVFGPCQLSKNICSHHDKHQQSNLNLGKFPVKTRKIRIPIKFSYGLFLYVFYYSSNHRKSTPLILSRLMTLDALKRIKKETEYNYFFPTLLQQNCIQSTRCVAKIISFHQVMIFNLNIFPLTLRTNY